MALNTGPDLVTPKESVGDEISQERKFMSCSYCQEFGQLADLASDR